MYNGLKQKGKNVEVVIPKFSTVFNFLPRVDEIKKFGKQEVYDLAIALDCGDIKRLNGFANYFEYANCKISIDHHEVNTMFADYNFVNPAIPACAQILITVLEYIGVEITKDIAKLIISGIISDTLFFKSPTTTKKDVEVANELSEKFEINLDIYGMELLESGTDLSSYSAEELITLDAKETVINGMKMIVAQVNTVSIYSVMQRKAEIEEAMRGRIMENLYSLFVFVVTDILECNSQAIVLGNKQTEFAKAFNVEIKDNICELKGVVSRKKQIFPVMNDIH
jgi:manganese-dependent inorganic pyrophosphatase